MVEDAFNKNKSINQMKLNLRKSEESKQQVYYTDGVVIRLGNMDHEKGRYQKIGGFRDVDIANDRESAQSNEGKLKRYYKWQKKKHH